MPAGSLDSRLALAARGADEKFRTGICRTLMSMSKSERIELRVSPADKEAIAAAAAMEHATTTDFVRRAVLDRAQYVRARADHTLMPAAQFDGLVAALDTPDDTPALAREVARRRRFVQR